MKKHILPLLALLASALPSSLNVQAAIRLNVPEQNQPPFYARIEQDAIHDDDWAAIVFYRDPSCVPADFNLLEFFDFTPDPDLGLRVFGCPMTVSGFEVWENGPGLDLAPIQTKSRGMGAVPIWFVMWPELEVLIADNNLTIEELSSAASLRMGLASFYNETLHPSESVRVPHITISASGQLTDGTSFRFQAVSSGEPLQHVLIRFGDTEFE